MKLRGVLPVIVIVVGIVLVACVAGCASPDRPPTQIVRSSRALTSMPTARPREARRFKETIFFSREQPPSIIDPREKPVFFALPAALDVRMPTSPIELTLTSSTAQTFLGDDDTTAAHVDVALNDAGDPIVNATIDAVLRAPLDHARRPLPTLHVGADGHAVIDLSQSLRADDPIGPWTIEVRAKGTSNGVSFDRFGTLALHVARRTAQIVDLAPARVLDDGAVEADVRLAVTAHDRLEITGILQTATGAPIAAANTTATFDPGTTTATLRFDREALRTEGPYILAKVRLFSITSHTTMATRGE